VTATPARLLAALLVLAGLASLRTVVRPSVLLVVVDTLRADHLGCYGYARPTSPNLDALAARGVRFAEARSASSWTGASVATILTGLYPAVHGLERYTSALSPALVTMAEGFREAGYETAAFSANPAAVVPEVGFGQGFGRFDVLHGPEVGPTEGLDVVPGDPLLKTRVLVATADVVTDAALAWIRTHARAPFFAYVHYFDPHAGYFPPPEYAARFGVAPHAPMAGKAQWPVIARRRVPLFPGVLTTLVALYDGEIAFTDAEVGRLLAGVGDAVRSPTLLVVTADHGEEFGEHGGLQHGYMLWEEQLHVPLILAGAGVPSHGVVETPVSLVDLWPTIADLTGLEAVPDAAVRSWRGLIAGRPGGPAPPLYADLESDGGAHTRAEMDGRWKLLRNTDGTVSLYDLAADPAERHDLRVREPERARALAERLQARDAAARVARAHAEPGAVPLSAARRARLKALGYIH
jgi:arylsulfatase A-like enzyme